MILEIIHVIIPFFSVHFIVPCDITLDCSAVSRETPHLNDSFDSARYVVLRRAVIARIRANVTWMALLVVRICSLAGHLHYGASCPAILCSEGTSVRPEGGLLAGFSILCFRKQMHPPNKMHGWLRPRFQY